MTEAPERPQRPRGTRDFSPAEMRARRRAEERMRGVFASFGYQEVATPTFEELALFTAKSGEGIREELYAFQDKGGRWITLRPELTAPVLRYYYSELAMEPKPLRLFYFGNCFRYDRPQKGRFREFWQMGCELIGPDGPEAGAEVVALGVTMLRSAGVADLVVRVGHLGILKGLLEAAGVPAKGPVMRHADKREVPQFLATCREAGASDAWLGRLESLFSVESLEETAEIAKGVPRAEEGVAFLRSFLTALSELTASATRGAAPGAEAAGSPAIRVDPAIARGLDYYTGLVFEMDSPSLGAEKQLLGGGAYDLSGVFGGAPTGSIGFGLGFDRTLLAAGKEREEAPRADLYLIGLGEKGPPAARRLAATLREAGIRVDLDVMGRKPAKGLQYANATGIPLVVVLGDKEVEAGEVKVKEMATGKETGAPLAGLASVVRDLIGGRA